MQANWHASKPICAPCTRLAPGAKDVALDEGESSSDYEENEAGASGSHIPIPTETFLEELSVKLQLHPISVYWLAPRYHTGERGVDTAGTATRAGAGAVGGEAAAGEGAASGASAIR